MNKRLNTFLFIIGATATNLLIMAVLAVGGFVILRFLPIGKSRPGLTNLLMIFVFFGAIIGSFFIYHTIIKAVSKRVNMEKYFHPIFRRRDDSKPNEK